MKNCVVAEDEGCSNRTSFEKCAVINVLAVNMIFCCRFLSCNCIGSVCRWGLSLPSVNRREAYPVPAMLLAAREMVALSAAPTKDHLTGLPGSVWSKWSSFFLCPSLPLPCLNDAKCSPDLCALLIAISQYCNVGSQE